MSLAGDRAELKNILSAVEGVAGFAYRSKGMAAGDAWPLLESLDASLAGSFQATWRIVVVLPADEVRASEWFDEHHEAIADALNDFGVVDRILPAAIDTEAGDRNAMLFTVRREA